MNVLAMGLAGPARLMLSSRGGLLGGAIGLLAKAMGFWWAALLKILGQCYVMLMLGAYAISSLNGLFWGGSRQRAVNKNVL